MLVDSRTKSLFTYQCSIVQYNNFATHEIFNIGVVLFDGTHYVSHLPRTFQKLKRCINFNEISGLNYTLSIIEDRMNNFGTCKAGNVSNVVSITPQYSFQSKLPIEMALYDAVDKFISIPKLRETDNNVITDRYDKISVLRLIETRAKERNISNFKQRQHFNVAKKMIDMALVDKDNNPYVVASMASLHTEHFDDSLISSLFTLQEVMRNPNVKDQFLYVPKIKDILSTKENQDIGWAREQAQHINVDIITDPRHDAVLERLQSNV